MTSWLSDIIAGEDSISIKVGLIVFFIGKGSLFSFEVLRLLIENSILMIASAALFVPMTFAWFDASLAVYHLLNVAKHNPTTYSRATSLAFGDLQCRTVESPVIGLRPRHDLHSVE